MPLGSIQFELIYVGSMFRLTIDKSGIDQYTVFRTGMSKADLLELKELIDQALK